MPTPNSIGPLRVLPTKDTTALAHDLNRAFDTLTQYLNNRFGFSGPVAMHNSVDFRGNPGTNVSTSSTPSNAATVEQLAVLQTQVKALAGASFVTGGGGSGGTQAATFQSLLDGPGGYSGHALQGVRVAASETVLEYVALVTSMLQLSDVPDSFVGQAFNVLQVNAAETAMQWAVLPQTVLALLDTPDSYAGQANTVLRVKADETGIEFVAGGGGYTNEEAQDAVGTILVDTATIDLTYADATPSITAAVVAGSIGATHLANDGVTYTKIQNVTDARLLGRSAGSAGDVQELTVGTGLALSGGVLSAAASGPWQPLDATLTALAGLATGANQMPYATGTDTFAQTTLSPYSRTLLDDLDATAWRVTLLLGTMSTQDATAVAITGGVITGLTSLTTVNLLATGEAQLAAGARGPTFTVPNRAGNDQVAFQGDLSTAGTNRWNLFMTGGAPNYLAGALGVGAFPLVGPILTVQGETRLVGGLVVDGGIAALGLSVANRAGDNQVTFQSDLSSVGTNRWNLYVTGAAPNYLAGPVCIGIVNGTAYTLYVNGSAGIPGGAWINSTSRASLKANPRMLGDALPLLRRLTPTQWEWATDQTALAAQMPGTQTGFVVEDVQAVQPQWTPLDGDGVPGLAMRGLEAYLTRAVQQLDARLMALEAARGTP